MQGYIKPFTYAVIAAIFPGYQPAAKPLSLARRLRHHQRFWESMGS